MDNKKVTVIIHNFSTSIMIFTQDAD